MLKEIKNIVLEELHKYSLNESLSDIVYHFTTKDALVNILKTNKMFCQSILGGSADDMHPKYLFYISFTRNKSPYEGFGYASSLRGNTVRIEFDGALLNQNFKGGPVNYWGASESLMNKWYYQRRATGMEDGAKNNAFTYESLIDGESVPNDEIVKKVKSLELPFVKYPTSKSPNYIKFKDNIYRKVPLYNKIDKAINTNKTNDNELYTHRDNEIEDRLFTNKSYIEDILKYIKRIDVLIPQLTKETKFPKNDFYEIMLRFGYNKKYKYGKIFIYDNKKDFNFQTENYVNEKYLSLCDDIPEEHYIKINNKTFNPSDVARFFWLLRYKEKIDKSIVYCAKTLRQHGFDEYARETINKLKNTSGWDIYSSITNYCQELSHHPSEIGQRILKMFSNELVKNGYHDLIELYKEYRVYQTSNNHGNIDWNKIDTNIVKKFKCFKLYGYQTYDITNDNETDIWYMLSLRDLKSRYYFIDRIIDDTHYELPPIWIYKVRGNDEEKFKKYLQSLAHGKLTLSKFIQILKKVGFNGEKIKEYLEYPKIYSINANWSDYVYKYRLQPPCEMNSDEENLRTFNIFKKQDLENE